MELLEFKMKCLDGYCLRNTMKSKNCIKEYKQEQCFRKLMQKQENEIQEKETENAWAVCKEQVFIRDNNKCQIWNILTSEEKKYILNNYMDDYKYLSKSLDPAHIKPKGSHPELKNNEDNIVTVCRYFHSLLDTFKHPVTKVNINSEERENWLESAKNKKRVKLL